MVVAGPTGWQLATPTGWRSVPRTAASAEGLLTPEGQCSNAGVPSRGRLRLRYYYHPTAPDALAEKRGKDNDHPRSLLFCLYRETALESALSAHPVLEVRACTASKMQMHLAFACNRSMLSWSPPFPPTRFYDGAVKTWG